MEALQMGLFGTRPVTQYSGTIIYETKGRAREYCELACNLYNGCGHRCEYCYVVSSLQRERTAFEAPRPRNGVLSGLARDAVQYGLRGERRPVLLCFTCDPYQPLDDQYQYTRRAIETLHSNGLGVEVLTKGGSRALRDLDLFGSKDSFATSLTFVEEQDSLAWEPGAATPQERMDTIRAFHQAGIRTWASLEPVVSPAQSLELIRQTHAYVDHYKVGTLNHHPRAAEINWPKFARDAKALLESLGKSYYLKRDLRAYLV